MTDATEEGDDLDWREIMETLSNGSAVEIPFDTEKEAARRERQIAKRAERNGLAVAVQRSASALRVEPRGAAAPAAGAASPAGQGKSDEDREAREERRQERAQRREAAKAEKSAAREG